MKIGNIPGEFGFKALIKEGNHWLLTKDYFFTIEEVKSYVGAEHSFKWPVEVQENNVVYIPNEDEFNG